MKIQTLGIIFIIIILPISFALSLYTKTQLETLSLQSLYDTKLQQATYDALQAFQLNTQNNTESTLADSKIKDIEASVSAFFNSLSSNFGLQGYSKDELKEYIPAIVYTMYDGYYIYSPYSNVATTTDSGVVVNQNETENVEYGLKPYIYYSCRYKRASDDFVITYSLDNYITIKGIIAGKYVNDAGYIISNIEPFGDGTYKYNGIVIEAETALEEYIGNTKYQYVKINGTKYYLDETRNRIFYILNGNIHEQISLNKNADLYNKYVQLIKNNTSALMYYKEAYEFTNRVLDEYDLKNLQITNACDMEGKQIKFATNAYKNIFKQDDVKDKTPLEYSTSNFNQHRKEVIRYTIESNLSMAIANFNKYTQNVAYNYQMPNLKETDWDMLSNNVSVVSFLQGLNLGGKIYNGYSVVLNTETEELVREQDIYIVGKDEHYHRVEDKYLLEYKTLGDYVNKASYSKGVLDLDFQITSVNGSNDEKIYYYPKRELSCYECIVNQSGVNYDFKYDNVYEYLNNLSVNTQTTLLKKVYYTSLGRERWSSRLNNIKIEDFQIVDIDEDFDTNEVKIDFNPKTYTNKQVDINIKFTDSINLDKVVIAISSPPELSNIEYQTLVKFENGDFTNITSKTMKYTVTENSIIYVVAFSKTGKKIIEYDVIDWIDKTPPIINSVVVEEIEDNSSVVKKYNSIEEYNNRGYKWTKNAVRLTIDAQDELYGSGVDRIEYTYDNGSTVHAIPKVNGGIWTIDYTFNGNIKIRSVDVAGNEGNWTNLCNINIDKERPTKTIVTLRDEKGNVYNGKTGPLTNLKITQQFSSNDSYSGIARFEYSYNRVNIEGTFLNPSQITTSMNRVFYVRAVDNVGNIGEWSDAYIINLDNTSPSKVTMTLKYDNGAGTPYVSGTVTNRNIWQQAHASDNVGIARYEYTHDFSSISSFTNPWTIDFSVNETFYVRAIDTAGNQGPWSEKYVLNIDKNPPTFVGSLTGNVQNINQVKLNLTLGNASEISKIEIKYKVNGASGNYNNKTINSGITQNYQHIISNLEYSTQYDIYLILYDFAGNYRETNHINIATQMAPANDLIAQVQNKNQISLNLNISNIEKIQRVDVKYKESNTETYTTVQGAIAPQFSHILNLRYSTTYNIYVQLYDVVGNSVTTGVKTLTTETDHIHQGNPLTGGGCYNIPVMREKTFTCTVEEGIKSVYWDPVTEDFHLRNFRQHLNCGIEEELWGYGHGAGGRFVTNTYTHQYEKEVVDHYDKSCGYP